MRYMMIIKSDAKTEAGTPPDETFGNAMGNYNQEMIDAGVFATAEGLQASSNGARITLDDGKFAVQRGPFGNPDDLVAGYWVIETSSKDDAIEWAKRCPFQGDGSTYADGSGQVELRPFIEMPGDQEQLAFIPENASASEGANGSASKRFISMVKGDAKTESGEMPPPEVFKAMGAAMEPLIRDGILLAAGGLLPSSQGTRVNFSGGRPVVIDGPFAETKELIAGFAMLRVGSIDDAIELTKQAMHIEAKWRDEPIEFEVRQLFDM